MPKRNQAAQLKKEDYELLSEFRYRLRCFLGFSENAAIEHGVTPQQYQAMLSIHGFPGRDWVTVGELAEKMQIEHHSAGGLVRRMETAELAKKEASPDDGRVMQIRLTDKGLSILSKLIRVHQNELGLIGPNLIDLLHEAARKGQKR
ncbi:MarR family transcriptional regulator [Pelagicoccus sp. SDUM812005]|uniref:MarR family winged helix-turn-helix transcriptional regulator n=1 Tax=Pelagicoccus sp. SDUM812005 TaxID=3041257 RepID=UPI00280D1591|nr:MarR family transcriptional regulator [Pelagicoccus sp. SDUM812005]MDQ8182255.1 MarR family transcriptional regulator [Pelagicoccus sp. SDUM812005]